MRKRVAAVLRKEFRELRRDRTTLWIAMFLPVVMLFVFGYGVRLDVGDVPMAVLDEDGSAASAALVDAFVNTGDFAVRRRVLERAGIRDLLDRSQVRLALVIPHGFEADLAAGRPSAVQTLIDGSHSPTAFVLRDEVAAVTAAFQAEWRGMPPAAAGPAAVESAPRIWYNPAMRSEIFVVSGLFAVILMAFPPLLTVLAVVREKESGAVQQVYVSPLRPWEFIAGKLLSYVIVAFLELVSVMLLGKWWFHLPFRGSPILLLVASLLYVFCTVGIGLLVSTVTRSQVVGVLLALIITVMPSFLFSGFMFPISAMPRPMQWYTRIFPPQYFLAATRDIFLKGSGWALLARPILVLAGYTMVVFAIATLRFKKKLA